ncbi:MAG TPA: hypothetical protein DCG49_13475 [Ruminococcus sp.]|nr:hypothetical protein [Ruminococcus sp.]
MFRFMRKAKGSISIFLCLIMLPMVTYSTMIIDASRLQAAKASIASAGDLTMNAAMSEYEQILQDMYGLFAVAQSEDDLKPALKAYFKQTIESQIAYNDSDRESAYVQNMANELVEMIFDQPEGDAETVWSNFLQMQIDGFNYTPVDGSALANPAVMKRQVIDYMKYKGPVSLVSTLFRKLDFLKNSSKQADAVEKKIDYTKTLESLEDPCMQAYYALFGNDPEHPEKVGYNPVAGFPLDSGSGWNDFYEFAGSSGTPGITMMIEAAKEQYKYMTASKILYVSAPFQSGIDYSTLQSSTDYGYITSRPEESRSDMESKLDALIEARNQIINVTNDIGSAQFESAMGSIQVNVDVDSEDYRESSFNAVVNYNDEDDRFEYPVMSRIQDGGTWKSILDRTAADSSLSESDAWNSEKERYNLQTRINDNISAFQDYVRWREDYAYLTNEISRLENALEWNVYNYYQDEYSDDEEAGVDWYSYFIDEINRGSLRNYVFEAKASVAVKNRLDEVYNTAFSNFLSALGNRDLYNNYADQFENDGYGCLCTAYIYLLSMQETLGDLDTALQAVKDKIHDVQAAKDAWQTSINQVDSSSTRTSMQNDIDTATEGINEEDVDALKARAGEIKQQVDTMIADMESIKYLEQQICRTQTMSDLAELADANIIQRTLIDLYAPDDAFPTPPDFSGVSDFEENRVASDGGEALTKAQTLIDTKFVHNVDTSHFSTLQILDGEPEDEPSEKFVKVLKDIANPIESQGLAEDSDTANEYEQIQEAAGNVSEGTPGASMADNAGDGEEVEQEDPDSEPIACPSGGEDGETYFLYQIQNYQSSYEESLGGLNPDSYAVSGVDLPDSDDDSADPGASLSAAKGLLELIANIGTEIRDTAYMEEYFTEVFTCRTDKLRDANVVLLNGYTNQEGAAKQLNTNTEWYGKEIEFIIWGDGNLDANLTKNDALIFAIRFALNAIYAFTAADIQSFALEIATAIAGWTVIGVPIVQACITIGIALAESAWDLHLLHQGKDVAIYKNATTFVCSPAGALKTVATEVATEVITEVVDTAVSHLEEHIDSTIDSLEVSADQHVSDYATQLEGLVNEYIEEQTEQIRAAIESTLVTPLVNKLMSVPQMMRVDGKTAEQAVSDAVDSAFAVVEESLDRMNDGKLKEIATDFFNTQSGVLKTSIMNQIVPKFQDALGGEGSTINSSAISQALIAPLNAETGDVGIITGILEDFKETIRTKLDDVKRTMTDNISGAIHESAGNMKDFLHRQMDAASESIKGTVSSTMQSIAGSDVGSVVTNGADTAATSGGLTLNYKEYCKIFVLLNAATNETKMLRRAAALIQANVRHPADEDMANGDFEMIAANTLVSVHADLKLGTLFPWCVSDTVDEGTGEDSLDLDFSNLGGRSVTIKYNGINGY